MTAPFASASTSVFKERWPDASSVLACGRRLDDGFLLFEENRINLSMHTNNGLKTTGRPPASLHIEGGSWRVASLAAGPLL